MVNEEKVRLMTRLAMYEQSTGREDLEKGKYFKSDYVKYNCLKTLVSTTILYVVVVATYIYYNMGELVTQLVEIDLFSVAYKILIAYALVCIFFMVVAWFLYSYRYKKAKPHIIIYNQNLKKLIAFYENEEKTKGKKRRK